MRQWNGRQPGSCTWCITGYWRCASAISLRRGSHGPWGPISGSLGRLSPYGFSILGPLVWSPEIVMGPSLLIGCAALLRLLGPALVLRLRLAEAAADAATTPTCRDGCPEQCGGVYLQVRLDILRRDLGAPARRLLHRLPPVSGQGEFSPLQASWVVRRLCRSPVGIRRPLGWC